MTSASRYHETQRFHGAVFAVLLAALLVVALSTAAAIGAGRPMDPLLVVIGPATVVLITVLFTLSHLDVDVTDREVRIAFRYLWPARRIHFEEITSLSVRRYNPILEYGGWGVRLGPAGWAFNTGGNTGVQLRLRSGLPVLIGSRRPYELEAAIRTEVERHAQAR
jgi:hypothetical protein